MCFCLAQLNVSARANGCLGAGPPDEWAQNRRSALFRRSGLRYPITLRVNRWPMLRRAGRIEEATMHAAIPSLVDLAKVPWNKGRLTGKNVR